MKRYLYALFFALGIFFALPAKAVCPVCTVAVAGGLGLSRWLGIDDSITGVWIGGLLASVSAWTINWLKKKNINFFVRDILVIIFWYSITLFPLWRQGVLGHPLNTVFGVDKLIFGTLLGSLIFYGASVLYEKLKKINNGKAHFPFEKVVIPIVALALGSMLFYLIVK